MWFEQGESNEKRIEHRDKITAKQTYVQMMSRWRKKNNTLHVYLICRPGVGPAHNKHNKTQMQITMTQIQIVSRQHNRWHTQKKHQITRQKNAHDQE